MYKSLLLTIAISALIASSSGDEENTCPVVDGNVPLHEILIDHLGSCFTQVGDLDVTYLRTAEDLPGLVKFFRQYCRRQDLITSCLDTVTVNSTPCLNETQLNDFRFLELTLKTALTLGCIVDGEHLAIVMFAVVKDENTTPQANAVVQCIAVAESGDPDGGAASSRVFGFYRELKVFKKCLVEKFQGLNQAVFSAEMILNGLLRTMKCPRPEDSATVLCATLDAKPPSTTTEEQDCPFKTENVESDLEILKTTTEQSIQCLKLNVDNLDFLRVENFTTIEEFRNFFIPFCRNVPLVKLCLGDVFSNSKVCQTLNKHKLLNIFTDLLESILKNGCKQGGEVFVTIINGIVNKAEDAVQREARVQCMDAALEELTGPLSNTGNVNDTNRGVKTYRVMKTLKECVANGSPQEDAFKTVFATFIDEVLSETKCVGADDGDLVLCHSLGDN